MIPKDIMKEKNTLNQSLSKILSKKELSIVPSSFDIVGDILIFAYFPEELIKKDKHIAKCFLDFYKQIKVVCRKTSNYSGVFRTPKLKILAGERRKETVHKENNCRIMLDVEKCYFSPRLSTERQRITSLVKSGEEILVMFSGAGPYPVVISKNTKAAFILGVEINPTAHEYALKNLAMNKLQNVELRKGDVKRVLPQLKRKFDRVLMPLPKDAENFLDTALSKLKKRGILQFYDFLHENDFALAEQKVKEACKRNNRKFRKIGFVKCGQYSPRTFRVCLDAKIA